MRRWVVIATCGVLGFATFTASCSRESGEATNDGWDAGGDPGGGAAAEGDAATPPPSGDVGSSEEPTAADRDPETPLSEISERCKGFDVLGLEHSPGGDVLPNECAPFHGTLNNPYAIRCVDANPDYETQWAGDEYCILPPPPELGTQVRVGPSSYTDPAAYEAFLLEPGAETNTYYYIDAENTESQFYYRTNWRMRDGSHHMIISVLDADREDGWATGSGNDGGGTTGSTNFGGAQRTDVDRPLGTLEIPEENRGMGAELAPHQQFSFNLHHMNRFQEPILREAWVNIWYMDEADVTMPLQSVAMFGNPRDLDIPPGERRELHYRCDVTGNTRIVTLLGHRHANTDRFGVWIERAPGERISVYESFDYEEMPTYQYDSLSSNPVPDVETRTDGGHTGLLEVAPGDEIHFVCDVTNRQDVQLRFANELFTGEMCIVFGSMTGDPLCRLATRVMP